MRNLEDRKAYIIIIVLGVLGIVLSYMALVAHANSFFNVEGGPALCNISAVLNCQGAIASKWSMLWGRPIAIFGMVFYALLVVFTFLTLVLKVPSSKTAWNCIFLAGFLASLYALFLLYVSIFEIKSVCPVCFGTYLVNFLVLGLAWWKGDKTENIVIGITSALKAIIFAPIKFFTVWSKKGLKQEKFYAIFAFLGLLAVLVVGDVFPSMVVQKIRGEESQKGLELPWPKADSFDLSIYKLDQSAFGDYYSGNLEAPIKIVEFFDYECPACKYIYQEMKELLKNYEGKYLWVYKNYPLDGTCNSSIQGGHKRACFAASFTRCAGEQGKFHEVNDYILSLPMPEEGEDEWTFEKKVRQSYDLFGLDTQAMNDCTHSGRQLPVIKKDIEQGNAIKLHGTPTIIINGRVLRNITMQSLETVFKDILGVK